MGTFVACKFVATHLEQFLISLFRYAQKEKEQSGHWYIDEDEEKWAHGDNGFMRL
jgi:nuclear transport factor 2 (NTF2) superfamily protein